MMPRSTLVPAAVAFVLVTMAACHSAPRQRPVKAGPVNEGAGTLTAARKYLEGRWTLESFEVFPPGKPAIKLTGAGTLNYDEFGNMRMEIRADEKASDLLRAAGVEIRDGVISTDGRTVVDMQNRTLSYVVEGQKPGAAPAGPLSPSVPRHWQVDGDNLTLTTEDKNGKPLSVGHWKRMP
jgi:hypothetical protein